MDDDAEAAAIGSSDVTNERGAREAGRPSRLLTGRGPLALLPCSRRKGCCRPALRMGKPRLSGAKPLPRATQAPSQTRTRPYSHTRGPAAPSALLGSLVLRVLGSQGRGGAAPGGTAPGGTLEGEARGQAAAGGDANTPGAGALRAADTDREGRGCGRAGEGRGAERKGGWGTGRHLPRRGGARSPRPSSELVCAARAAGAHPLRSKGPGRRHGQALGALALPASFSLWKTRILENLGESGTPGLRASTARSAARGAEGPAPRVPGGAGA